MTGVRQGFEFIQGSLTVYTCVKCPIVGQKFCVNAPSKAPLRPEGGVVGEYIDRCIILRPILKTWVPFYSLEHKEFENLFIVFVF